MFMEQTCVLLWGIFLFLVPHSTEAKQKAAGGEPSDEELMAIASLLQGPSQDKGALDINNIMYKTQPKSGEQLDYGRGGESFSSENQPNFNDGGQFAKRYDPFNVGGRFGKRYDQFNVGGRFGKRSDPFNVGGRFGKRYDPFNVGGRFGKRYDPFNVGGRFGKRNTDKRYDMFNVGGRFGKRSDE